MGLPYLNDIVYKFFLYAIYGEFITEEKPHYQRIENSNFSFKIMTYNNENYRKIITYFLKSEIEQAVGRARLLRFDCNVYLYSGFPAEQAELVNTFDLDIDNEEETEIKNLEKSSAYIEEL